MRKLQYFLIRFADIVIRFEWPEMVSIPEELIVFQIERSNEIHAEYKVELLEQPLEINSALLFSGQEMEVYKQNQEYVRVFKPLIEKNGCQVACVTNERGKNKLYYPAIRWPFYSKELHFIHLLGIEEVLLRCNAFLFHSSMVQVGENTILFSGPSGIGKSTQASLWEKYLAAGILNGDRCIIRKFEKGFYGCGSPWCGTSKIYSRTNAPLKGIFILKQSAENKIRRLKAEAFVKIYQQTIVNAWNDDFIIRLSDLIAELLEEVPVYELSCRPDEEAVMLAYRTLFEGDI